MPPKQSRFAADDDDLEEYMADLSAETLASEHGDVNDPIFMSLDKHTKGILSPEERDAHSPVRHLGPSPPPRLAEQCSHSS